MTGSHDDLVEALEELERVDPSVAAAAKRYDEVVDEIVSGRSLSDAQLDAILEAAGKATPGPWRRWRSGVLAAVSTFVCQPELSADVDFIALANPATVASMAEELKRLRAALNEIAWYGGGDGGDWAGCCDIARFALATNPEADHD